MRSFPVPLQPTNPPTSPLPFPFPSSPPSYSPTDSNPPYFSLSPRCISSTKSPETDLYIYPISRHAGFDRSGYSRETALVIPPKNKHAVVIYLATSSTPTSATSIG